MAIKYRILYFDEKEHSIGIRYFTDIVTEQYLASEFNEDGSIKLNEHGYPIRCRSDYHINITDNDNPTQEDIKKLAINYAPKQWMDFHGKILQKQTRFDGVLNNMLHIQHEIDDSEFIMP